MEMSKEKSKRHSSKTKEKDGGTGDHKESKKSSDKTKSDKKERIENVEANGHSNDKKHSRDDSKTQPKVSEKTKSHKRDESSEKHREKRDDSKKRVKESEKENKTEEKRSKHEKSKEKSSNNEKTSHDKKKNEADPANNGVDVTRKSRERSKIPIAGEPETERKSESRKSSANKGKPMENGATVKKEDNDDNYDYEEDFEDYEEDFEDDEEPEEQEGDEKDEDNKAQSQQKEERFEEVTERKLVARAQSPENNNRTRTSSKNTNDNQSETSAGSRPATVQSRIDFGKAKVSEMQIAGRSKWKRRENELLNLIELDATTFQIFDLAPIRDYEFFMQNFGKSNMKQVQLQTDDNVVEREIQSDEIDVENKWSQHPPTDAHGAGGDVISVAIEDNRHFSFDTEILNSSKFRKFIDKSGKLIIGLLEEDDVSVAPTFENKVSFSFSDGYSTLGLGLLAKKCHTCFVSIAQDHSNILLTAFYVEESPLEEIENKGVVCIWNSNNSKVPQKMLLADSRPICCCFSPDIPSTVFAGLADGSVAVWDLHESENLHKTIPWLKDEIPLRIPTYDTSYLTKDDENLVNPIVDMVTMGGSSKKANNASSYQLAVLEETGHITIWTVLMTTRTDSVELDLGLSPGGRMKLVKAAKVKPNAGINRQSDLSSAKLTSCHSLCLGFAANRSSDFYIGTDGGYISHSVRHESKHGPFAYKPELEAISDVLCLHFSPFESSVLIAGFSDGTIGLYKTNMIKPLGIFQITDSQMKSVRCVQWSPNSPYVFYSLHGEDVLACWDLKHNKQQPINIEKTKPLISMSLSNWVYSEDQVRAKAFMLLACADGTAEIHCLKSSGSSKYSRADGQKLLTIVERL